MKILLVFTIIIISINKLSSFVADKSPRYVKSNRFLVFKTSTFNQRTCNCLPVSSSCSCCESVTMWFTQSTKKLCINFKYQGNTLNIEIALDSTVLRSQTVTNYQPFRICTSLPESLFSSACAQILELNLFTRSITVCPRLSISSKKQKWDITYTCISISTTPTTMNLMPGQMGAPGQMGQMGAPGQMGQMGASGQMSQMGASGQMGQMGAAGQMGQMGAPGQMGQMGSSGQMGQMGAPGQMGQMGASGQMGQMGTPGQMGQMGALGQMGPMGPMGAPGQMGPMGQMGQMGAAGQMGPMRPVGQMGASGSMAQAGAAGQMGAPGQMGQMGALGQMGPMGPMGAPGQMGPMGQMGAPGQAQLTMPSGITPYGVNSPRQRPRNLENENFFQFNNDYVKYAEKLTDEIISLPNETLSAKKNGLKLQNHTIRNSVNKTLTHPPLIIKMNHTIKKGMISS